MNWKVNIALALFLVTARMYTSLLRMYWKEQEPRTRTGVAALVLSVSLALRMCVRKVVPRLRLQCVSSHCQRSCSWSEVPGSVEVLMAT